MWDDELGTYLGGGTYLSLYWDVYLIMLATLRMYTDKLFFQYTNTPRVIILDRHVSRSIHFPIWRVDNVMQEYQATDRESLALHPASWKISPLFNEIRYVTIIRFIRYNYYVQQDICMLLLTFSDCHDGCLQ